MKVGDLVKFPYKTRNGTITPVGIIVEIKYWADLRRGHTDAYVMWDSGEIINHDLYNLVRADDESR